MDIQQADKLAEKQLTNDVTDIVLGRMELAARTHSAVGMTQMVHYKESGVAPGTVEEEIFSGADFWPQDQARMFLGFRYQEFGFQADIYPKDDIAIIWDVDAIEAVCNMTVTNFWRFLNTIPNMYQYATYRRDDERTTEEGKFFLSYLAQNN